MGLRAPAALPDDQRTFNRWCRETDPDWAFRGSGSPEGVVIANRGAIFLRTDGSTNTTLYVKTANDGQATGWTAK